MIRLEGLKSGYGGIAVLDGIDLELEAGGFLGVLGHNGMGKTTLLKTIMGLLPATGGRIELDGREITHLPAHARARAGIGYVPQGRMIFPALSVLDNLRMGCVAVGRKPGDAAQILDEFPELRRLAARAGGALSGGEQQLLALARALCAEPRLILLDEPTEGIQPSIREAIAERLADLRRSRGLTLLLVEQNLDFIRALADRVLLIQRGRIVRELQGYELADARTVGEFTGLAAVG